MVVGMVFSFKNLLDVGTILSYSVTLAGLVQFFTILFWSRYLKITFYFYKTKALKKEIKSF